MHRNGRSSRKPVGAESVGPDPVVFLVDVDNTLLDNDGVQARASSGTSRNFGAGWRARSWAILEALFAELGYRDDLGGVQRYGAEHPEDIHRLSMPSWLVDYPSADRLYPGALEGLARLRGWGETVIVQDGVFQP
jgi:hypothetical protein